MRNIASFDVDAQAGFTPLCPNELPVPGGDEIASELNYMARRVDLRVGSKDAHPPRAEWTMVEPFAPVGLVNVDIGWPEHCVVGTDGFELIPGLPAVHNYDFFVYKGLERNMHPYGACYHDLQNRISTGVIEYLEHEEVGLVLVGGLALDYCVKTTAIQLSNVFKVVVYRPACRAVDEATGAAAIEEMTNNGIIVVDNRLQLDAIVEEW